MTDWEMLIQRYVIHDGKHGEIFRGDDLSFALRLWPIGSLILSDSETISASPIAYDRYRINAQVISLGDKICILDFGIRAFCSRKRLPDIVAGMFLSGEVSLGVDRYSYPSKNFGLMDLPPMIYSWRVNRITLEKELSKKLNLMFGFTCLWRQANLNTKMLSLQIHHEKGIQALHR